MKIKRVEITNFRGIDRLELDFLDPGGNPLDLVVLAGPNGIGKSSVLEACIIALAKENLLESRSSPQHDVRNGMDKYEIKLVLVENGNEIPVFYRLDKEGKAERENTSQVYDLPVAYFSSWRQRALVGNLSLGAGMPHENERQRLRFIKQYLINLKGSEFIDSESEEISRKKDFKNIFLKINETWNYFYPERNDRFEVKLISVEKGFDVFLIDDKNNYKIPVDVLSSGEMDVFIMISWLTIRNLSKGIVFIDEPELHLHPVWHRIILRSLKELLTDTQIICATHSDEILDAVYSYESFTLLHEEDPRVRLIKS